MGTTTADKLWALASHVTTNDNEAGNAFVMFRRSLAQRGGVEPYLVSFFGKANDKPDSRLEDAYNSLRRRYEVAENVHAQKIKQIEAAHQKALEQVSRQVSEAQAAFAAKEAELADLKTSGGGDERKRGRQTADYAACATGSAVCADQFQGMSSSHRAAGQSAAIFPVTSAM